MIRDYNGDYDVVIIEPSDTIEECGRRAFIVNGEETFYFCYGQAIALDPYFAGEERTSYFAFAEHDGRLKTRVVYVNGAKSCEDKALINDFTGAYEEPGKVLFMCDDERQGTLEDFHDNDIYFCPYYEGFTYCDYYVYFSCGEMHTSSIENTTYSEYSDAYFDTDDFEMVYIDGYGYVTQDTANDDFYWCEVCERYVHPDDWDCDHDCCIECAERNKEEEFDYSPDIDLEALNENPENLPPSSLDDYGSHNKDSMLMISDGAFFEGERTQFKGLGFELEMNQHECGISFRNITTWIRKVLKNVGVVMKYDGSVSNSYYGGGELVCDPRTLDDFLKTDWKSVFERLVEFGVRSHETTTCGLHVHVSRAVMTDEVCHSVWDLREKTKEAVGKLAAFMTYYESEIEKIARRNSSQWAAVIPSDYSKDSEEFLGNITERIACMTSHSSRYHAVNNSNSYTVELRVFRGTLNAETFVASVDFAYNLVKNAKDVVDFKNVSEWLKGMRPETIEYIKSRGAFEGAF